MNMHGVLLTSFFLMLRMFLKVMLAFSTIFEACAQRNDCPTCTAP